MHLALESVIPPGNDKVRDDYRLLLQPASAAGPLAVGGTLQVFFTAKGTQTTPELCAFDTINCG